MVSHEEWHKDYFHRIVQVLRDGEKSSAMICTRREKLQPVFNRLPGPSCSTSGETSTPASVAAPPVAVLLPPPAVVVPPLPAVLVVPPDPAVAAPPVKAVVAVMVPGTEGKSVSLTFGLLSPNKGIENVIRALPAILSRHPNVVYIVSGVTHPHIRRREGERYREQLQALAQELGVSDHLILNNRFVSAEELVEHVGAADIYITPYLQEAQVVSGTLAIALGAGKAVISTPYWHAKELLADKRGVIVPFADPDAIAEAVTTLLENEAERHAMRKRAYQYSRGTTWTKTARAYMASFQRRASSARCNQKPPNPATLP